jgi:hypothetical protein
MELLKMTDALLHDSAVYFHGRQFGPLTAANARLGDFVEFVSPFELPDFTIPVKSQGKIIDVDPDDGTVCVRLCVVPDRLRFCSGIVSIRPWQFCCARVVGIDLDDRQPLTM